MTRVTVVCVGWTVWLGWTVSLGCLVSRGLVSKVWPVVREPRATPAAEGCPAKGALKVSVIRSINRGVVPCPVSAVWHSCVAAHWSVYHCNKQAPSRFDIRCFKSYVKPKKTNKKDSKLSLNWILKITNQQTLVVVCFCSGTRRLDKKVIMWLLGL